MDLASHEVDRLTDVEAVARALVAQALSLNPNATPRVRRVARRLHTLYELFRAEGRTHRVAFAQAWHACHSLAERISA